MSDSVRPHRWKPTRLPCPWDSPGKNTGVGFHFLLQCMKVKSEKEVAQSCLTLSNPMDYSLPGSSIHGISQARVLEWGAIPYFIRDCQMAILCNPFFTHWLMYFYKQKPLVTKFLVTLNAICIEETAVTMLLV